MKLNGVHSEEQLLRRMAEGEHEAFDLVIAHYQPVLYSVALRWMKEKAVAKDIVQTVFMKLWLYKDSLKEIRSLDTYIFSILKRESYRALRHSIKVSKRREAYEDHTRNDLRPWQDEYLRWEDARLPLVREAMETLSPQRKMAFFLYFIYGMNRKQVAEKMNLSLETVKTHIRKSKEEVVAFCRKKLPGTLFLLLIENFF